MTALVWWGKCLWMRPGRVISGRGVLTGGETGPFRHRWEHRGPIPVETLAQRGRSAYTTVGIGESKRKSRFKRVARRLEPNAPISTAHRAARRRRPAGEEAVDCVHVGPTSCWRRESSSSHTRARQRLSPQATVPRPQMPEKPPATRIRRSPLPAVAETAVTSGALSPGLPNVTGVWTGKSEAYCARSCTSRAGASPSRRYASRWCRTKPV